MTKRSKAFVPGETPMALDEDVVVLPDEELSADGPSGHQLQHLRTLNKAELLALKEAFGNSKDAESFRPLAEAYLDLIRFLDGLVVNAGKGKGRHTVTALHQLSAVKGPGRWLISRLQEALGRGQSISAKVTTDPRLINKLEETEKEAASLRTQLAQLTIEVTEHEKRVRVAEKERDAARKATERLTEQLVHSRGPRR